MTTDELTVLALAKQWDAWPPCSCGQYRLHPDAQSCLEVQYGSDVTPALRVLDGMIEVGFSPDVTFSGYPNEGDECPCACHGAEE